MLVTRAREVGKLGGGVGSPEPEVRIALAERLTAVIKLAIRGHMMLGHQECDVWGSDYGEHRPGRPWKDKRFVIVRGDNKHR
jgi:hypothetical protein